MLKEVQVGSPETPHPIMVVVMEYGVRIQTQSHNIRGRYLWLSTQGHEFKKDVFLKKELSREKILQLPLSFPIAHLTDVLMPTGKKNTQIEKLQKRFY